MTTEEKNQIPADIGNTINAVHHQYDTIRILLDAIDAQTEHTEILLSDIEKILHNSLELLKKSEQDKAKLRALEKVGKALCWVCISVVTMFYIVKTILMFCLGG